MNFILESVLRLGHFSKSCFRSQFSLMFFGVPFSEEEKTEGLSTLVESLGITLNTMQI